MTTVIDTRVHATAIKAAVTAQLGPWSAYDYGEVPGSDGNGGTLPGIFALVSVTRRHNRDLRYGAVTDVTLWRVSVECVGGTTDEARWALSRVTAALNEQRLVIADRPTTLVQFETEQAPEPDDGHYSGASSWTYSA